VKRYILDSENRVLRRIPLTKILKIEGGCRKLHDELLDLCASPNIIREITS
jgi:hypothetical protein